MGQEIRDLRLLISGGQGFLGGTLVRALVALGFRKVAATARRDAPELERLGVEVVRCDLTRKEEAVNATRERDVIFHTAAKAGVWGSESSYEQINVQATRHLLEGAKQNGVEHFIHTSSPSVTFQGTSSELETEEAPYGRVPLNSYCRTKIQSEREVLETEGLKTLALRPHLIYGPGDPHLLPRVFEASEKGRLVRVGSGLSQVDVTHIRDAVGSQLCALAKRQDETIWGEAYFITSGVPIRLWSWLAHILHWRRLPGVRRSLSLKQAVALGRALEKVWARLDRQDEPPLTEFSALQLGCTHTYSIEKAQRLLGYEPSIAPYDSFSGQFSDAEDWSSFSYLFNG